MKKYLNLIVEMKHHLRTRLGDLLYTILEILLNSMRAIPAPSVKIPEPSAWSHIHTYLNSIHRETFVINLDQKWLPNYQFSQRRRWRAELYSHRDGPHE